MSIVRQACIALGLAAAAAAASPACASTQTVLHTMCTSGSCADGAIPQSQLLKSGNVLYGVAQGGSHGGGVVYQYDLSSSAYTVLYNFCSTHVAGHPTVCADGEGPNGRLIIDTNGDLYGTTGTGGNAHDGGTVWRLHNSGGTWSLTTIYKFCPTRIGAALCPDGSDPLYGLVYSGQASGAAYDGTSLLFGTTNTGGDDFGHMYGNGTVYALQLSGGTWSEQVIQEFCWWCDELCASCADGEWPQGQIVMDAYDRIWGSTLTGGTGGRGVVYQMTPGTNRWSDPWSETVLYHFCVSHATKCSDGSEPTGVMLDAAGNIYGTTQIGGSGAATEGNGVLWKLTNSAGTWAESIKYNFCSVSNCTDGWSPRGDLIMDGSGNIYGTTGLGGSNAIISTYGAGTIWKYNGSAESVLYAFCTSSGSCADGQSPGAGAIMDGSGNLYGTTVMGGTAANAAAGVVYKFVP